MLRDKRCVTQLIESKRLPCRGGTKIINGLVASTCGLLWSISVGTKRLKFLYHFYSPLSRVAPSPFGLLPNRCLGSSRNAFSIRIVRNQMRYGSDRQKYSFGQSRKKENKQQEQHYSVALYRRNENGSFGHYLLSFFFLKRPLGSSRSLSMFVGK